MMAMLSGQMTKIVIDVNVTPVPELQQHSERTGRFSLFPKLAERLWKIKQPYKENVES